ncbi:MAG: hypothetical protein FWD14_06085 [Treponema sp.]|nr:hypothetical protein [Treponema sp.]
MKNMYFKTGIICIFVCFIFAGCKSPPQPTVEIVLEEVKDTDITGTWFLGDQRSMIIFQYRADGTGCEINLNQISNFSLTYRPFLYTLTENSININFLDSLRPQRIEYSFEKPSANRLTVIDYIRGLSPTFIRQGMTELEGLWRRENTDKIAYLFGGRNFLVKLQDGIPTATGNFIVSETSVTINDLYRCTDYYSLRWTRSSTPYENFTFRINDDRLILSSPGREIQFIR